MDLLPKVNYNFLKKLEKERELGLTMLSKKFNNPLLEWHYNIHLDMYTYNNLNYKFQLYNWAYMINDLIYRIKCDTGVKLECDYENIDPNDPFDSPMAFSRSNISSGLLGEKNIDEIIKFSNGNIWEVGSGSGYVGYLLEQKDCNVYCTDIESSPFKTKFTVVDNEPDGDIIKYIAENNGALLYVWPIDEYHNFDLWKGNKIIIQGDFNIDKFYKSHEKTICPIFKKIGWKLKKTMQIPTNYGVNDNLQFWEKEER